MQIWVGLGNPGAQYAMHRHNVGFMAADIIAEAHGFSPWSKKFRSLVAEGRYEDNANAWTPKVSGVATQKFAGGRVAVALGLDYDKRHLQEQSTGTAQLDQITFSAGQIGAGVPLQAGKQYYMVDALDRSL